MKQCISSVAAVLLAVSFSFPVNAQDSNAEAKTRLALLEKENAELRKQILLLRERAQLQREASATVEHTGSIRTASAPPASNPAVLQTGTDVPVYYKAPSIAVPRFSWTGCYWGGHAGGIWASKDWSESGIGSFGGHDVKDWIGGVQGGCDYQSGQYVFGFQGDYGWSNGSGSNINPLLITAGGDPLVDRSRIDSLASVTARLGYAADRSLFYVRGGLAWERDHYTVFPVPTGVTSLSAKETRLGYTVGLGVEYAVNNIVSLFAEYDYYGFGTERLNFVSPSLLQVRQIDVKGSSNIVKVGMNLRFGEANSVR